MIEDRRITISDARNVGYCVSGCRHWAKLHKLDLRDFVENGIPASKLLATGDQMAIDLVNKVLEN